ncbi:MAG: sulfotransferase domain-containing protein [Cyanobacteria bacterium P01_C01_bin.72]
MYVVGYPKSGNTWLCFLLAYCLNAEYDDVDAPGVHPKNEYQRRYVKGGLDHPSYQDQVGQILKTHCQGKELITSSKPLIYLIRDGRDVMVSYYFFNRAYFNPRNFSLAKRYLVKTRNLVRQSFQSNDSQADFSLFLRQHTDEWVSHVTTWLEHQPTAVIRYESLKAIPEQTLNDVFTKLGVAVAPEVIKQALEIFDFKQLAQRKEGEEDRSSFFRKGIVGDWQNHFSAADLEFFQSKAASVMEHVGYEL